jgi:hypothetical protein
MLLSIANICNYDDIIAKMNSIILLNLKAHLIHSK